MIWRWLICFNVLWSGGVLFASSVNGQARLKDSKDAAVRKRMEYSGVVVYLQTAVPARSSAGRARMVQKNKTFSPHVLPVEAGATVEFPNLDPIFHNAFSNYNGQLFDVGLYRPGSTRSVRFVRPGVVRVFCNIHSTMSAVILVLETPYFATTNRQGEFEIDGVPPGEYEVRVFHERATEQTLVGLRRKVVVGVLPLSLEPIEISESGFLPIPHKNKYGKEYPPVVEENPAYIPVKE